MAVAMSSVLIRANGSTLMMPRARNKHGSGEADVATTRTDM